MTHLGYSPVTNNTRDVRPETGQEGTGRPRATQPRREPTRLDAIQVIGPRRLLSCSGAAGAGSGSTGQRRTPGAAGATGIP
jgi:hypothetical protein